MPAYARLTFLLCAALSLTACAPLLGVLGSSNTVIAVVTQIERVKMVGDGISYAKSKKTLTDHGLSALMDADCSLLNIITPDRVCSPNNDISVAEATEEAHVIMAAAPRDEIKTAPVALPAPLPVTLAAPIMLSQNSRVQAADHAGGDE